MKIYGLIGNPLGHSFSKKFFSEKFIKENLNDCRFELYPLHAITDLPLLLKKTENLHGLAVTIPYKETIMPFLDEIDGDAKKIGSVNCIKVTANKLTGYNTDVIGFERSFKPLLKNFHRKALILGSGGSSKAVQYVLKKLGIDFLVVSRNNGQQGFINYDTVDEQLINDHPVIINCTPVGMFPNEDEKPMLPYQYLNERNLLFDLVYKPAETKFLSSGKLQNAAIKNGYEMLIIQAEENWRIWNG